MAIIDITVTFKCQPATNHCTNPVIG